MNIKTQINVWARAGGLVAIGYCTGLFAPPWASGDLPVLWSGLAPAIPALVGIALVASSMKSLAVTRGQMRRELLQVPRSRWVALAWLVVSMSISQGGSVVGLAFALPSAAAGIVLWRPPWTRSTEAAGEGVAKNTQG